VTIVLEILGTTKIRHLIILASLLSFSLLANVVGATSAGVKSGDWIRYDINVSYGGQTVTGSIKISIQQVQGAQVNGTYEVSVQGYSVMQPLQFSLDVSTGIGSYTSGFIIPANLTVGQAIPGEAATVQNIVDWNGRKAILANTTSPYGGFAGQVYWDQQTGLFLESKGSAVGTTFAITAVETNLWSSGLFGLGGLTWVIIIIVILVIAMFAVALVLRKKKTQPIMPHPQTVPPPPPPPQHDSIASMANQYEAGDGMRKPAFANVADTCVKRLEHCSRSFQVFVCFFMNLLPESYHLLSEYSARTVSSPPLSVNEHALGSELRLGLVPVLP
jgi:hypothetical protein